MNKVTVLIQCPFCGNVNKRYITPDELQPMVVLCDVDDSNGCDRYFVAEVTLKPQVRTFAISEAYWEPQ